MIDSTARAMQINRTTSILRQVTSYDAIRQIGLSKPLILVGGMLFGSYVLRMTSIPWPVSRDVTNYAAIVITFCTAIAIGGRIAPVYLLGLLATAPSVFVSPNFDDSGLRWIGWALLITAVGPVLTGPSIFRLRLYIMLLFVAFIHIASIGSGILGAIGIQAPGGRGTFWGLLSHSNILSSIASLAAVDSLSRWSSNKSLWSKRLWLLIFIIELTTSIRAASRAALIGFIVCSIAIVHVRDSKSKVQLLAMILFVSVASIGIYAVRDRDRTSSMSTDSVVQSLIEKGTRNTREQLWTDRIEEFQLNPVFGSGFCMGGLGRMRVHDDGFVQEPGSSYLASLSMTGVVGSLGFLILIHPLMAAAVSLVRNRFGTAPPFYAVSSLFWLVAMLTEGFSHYVGSPFCFALYLWCGVAADAQKFFPYQEPTITEL